MAAPLHNKVAYYGSRHRVRQPFSGTNKPCSVSHKRAQNQTQMAENLNFINDSKSRLQSILNPHCMKIGFKYSLLLTVCLGLGGDRLLLCTGC